MDSNSKKGRRLQLIGTTHSASGKHPQRLKPKHMKRLEVNIAALTFEQMQSADDASKSMRRPGVTGKVILECTALSLMRRVARLELMNNCGRGLAA